MARLRNHCCSENATMRSYCVVQLHVTITNTAVLRVAQKCFYGELCRR